MKVSVRILAAMFVICTVPAIAADAAKTGGEFEELKARVSALEKKAGDSEGSGFVKSMEGLKISGEITMTGQVAKYRNSPAQRGAGVITAGVNFESPVGKEGKAVVVLDFVRGSGLANPPTLFVGPNGNPTGPNADIENFNNDQAHVVEAYYEHAAGPVVASIGQLAVNGYADGNAFAGSETMQFLANTFVSNPAVEWGGSPNFYGAGARLTVTPVKDTLDLTAAAFEGDGDYVDVFDNPFYIAEAALKVKPNNREGNYRLYYWKRHTRTDVASTADPNDPALDRKANRGYGLSFDQWVNNSLGLWLRFGRQNEKVAQFKTHASVGAHLTGALIGRKHDRLGIGYASASMSKVYREYRTGVDPAFRAGAEQYMEIYYSVSINDAEDETGLHITPSYQYIVNPGGDKSAGRVQIYGARLHVFF